VGDAPGQLADRLHLLSLTQLIPQVDPFSLKARAFVGLIGPIPGRLVSIGTRSDSGRRSTGADPSELLGEGYVRGVDGAVGRFVASVAAPRRIVSCCRYGVAVGDRLDP
jgi:hypothetical protein